MDVKKVLLTALLGFGLIMSANAESVFHDSKGQAVDLSNSKNKWIIVNYWASWCDSCLQEIPELNRFYQKNVDKNLVIYGVNYDHINGEALQNVVKQVGIGFPVLSEDPSKLWHLGSMEALPITFIINPKGEVVKRIVGPNTAQTLIQTVNDLQRKSEHAATA
jgi:thiol-disulfide isomerase/thioredoxin